VVLLTWEMFPAEQASIDRPRTGSNHCQCGAKDCEDDRDPRAAGASQGHPELNSCDERSCNRSPKAGRDEYSQYGSGEPRGDVRRGRTLIERKYPLAEQCHPYDESLKKKAEAWPAGGKGCKKSLQSYLSLGGYSFCNGR
jgi:hypothetical protein